MPHAFSTATPHVSVSIGIATATPRPELSQEDLSEAADKMLYLAKASGRNTAKGTQL